MPKARHRKQFGDALKRANHNGFDVAEVTTHGFPCPARLGVAPPYHGPAPFSDTPGTVQSVCAAIVAFDVSRRAALSPTPVYQGRTGDQCLAPAGHCTTGLRLVRPREVPLSCEPASHRR